MTIHYESGSANGQVDLVAKFATFVSTSTGGQWTLTEHLTPGGITGNPNDAQATVRMASPNDATYFHMTSIVGNARPRMRLIASTGFATGVISTSQTGVAGTSTAANKGFSVPASAVAFTYHFIAGPNYIYAVCKMAGGEYQHFSLGHADRYPGVNNGYWIAGCVPASVWSSVTGDWNDLTTPNFGMSWYSHLFKGGTAQQTAANASIGWFYNHAGSWVELAMDAAIATDRAHTSFIRSGQDHPDDDTGEGRWTFFTLDPQSSPANIITPLMPGYFIAPKIGRSGWWSIYGAIPGARACWTEAYAEDEEIIIGAEKWRIFPGAKSRRVVAYGSARFMGVAVRVE